MLLRVDRPTTVNNIRSDNIDICFKDPPRTLSCSCSNRAEVLGSVSGDSLDCLAEYDEEVRH